MNLRSSQRGMTLLGWIFTLVLIGAVSLLVMKLVPIYAESFKVDKALKSIIGQPGIAQQSPTEIYRQFARRMDIEDLERFGEQNVRKYVTVEKKGPKVVITVEYQAKTKLIGDLSLVADFKKQVSS